MNAFVIMDTGPLVAFLAKRSEHHAWVCEVAAELPAPFLTSEIVLAEAAHILRRYRVSTDDLLAIVEQGLLKIPFQMEQEVASVRRLMKRYDDVPMSLADACLVRMSELIPEAMILTLDSDFLIYRRHGRQAIPTLMPTTG